MTMSHISYVDKPEFCLNIVSEIIRNLSEQDLVEGIITRIFRLEYARIELGRRILKTRFEGSKSVTGLERKIEDKISAGIITTLLTSLVSEHIKGINHIFRLHGVNDIDKRRLFRRFFRGFETNRRNFHLLGK